MEQTNQDGPEAALTLVWLGPEFGLPTFSPFGLKLATWLRLAGIEHRTRVENDTRKGPKQKSPFIERGGEAIGDSELIIETLIAELGLDPDAHLDNQQRAVGLMLRRTFEDHFNFVHMHHMFVTDDGWAHSRPHFDFLPAPVRPVVARLIRRAIRKETWIQGLGRHSIEEMDAMGKADLDAASTLLGDQDFFFGDAPTLTDCTVYAFLAHTLWGPFETTVKAHLQARPNLVAFCERMRDKLWADEAPTRAAA